MNIPIPEFTEAESAIVAEMIVQRYGKRVPVETELGLDPATDALAFSEPDKSQKQIKDIVEAAHDQGADMIVTPSPLCQANVEVYQSEINQRHGTKLAMPVTYCSRLMTVAFGGTAKEAGLDGRLIESAPLQRIAAKPVK